MNLKRAARLILFLTLPLFSLHSQVLKAAVTAEPGSRTSEFFIHLSERSGIRIQPVPLLPHEFDRALKEGIVDLAVLPDTERSHDAGHMHVPVWGSPVVLMGDNSYSINERNLAGLRTVGVFVEDEPILMREVIDRYSIDPRIQRVRHYDSLVRIMATGRVSAILIPMSDFEKSVRINGEDPDRFGRPFPVGFKEDFLFLSRRNAERAAPHMDRIIRAIEEMQREGLLEELSHLPH